MTFAVKKMDKNRKLAIEIVKTLQKNRHRAYFAGGCVRDMLMGKPSDDYDVTTSARPQQIKKLFKRTVFVGAQFGTVLVVKNGIPFEVTTFRGKKKKEFSKDPETDVRNRDFTINGILYDPVKKEFFDYCGGQADIKKKIIRTIANPVKCFTRDRLRPLRAIRISSNLGFKIEEKTFDTIKKLKKDVNKVSVERIRTELVAIMTGKNPHHGVKLLDDTGLLKILLPEIEALKGVEQPPKFHPEGDVFIHTMLLIKMLKKADLVLAFSCLLHDCCKPHTFERTDRIRFNNHDRVGSRIARDMLARLRFSNDEIRKVSYCIENHMRIMNATKMREATLKKMFLKDTFKTELELHRLDCLASHKDLKIHKFLKRKYAAFRKKPILPKPILSGHELMAMGLKEGPVIGKIHRELIDEQFEGHIKSKKAAKIWVRKKWIKKKA